MVKLRYGWRSSVGWISLPLSSILLCGPDSIFASLSSSICVQNNVISICNNSYSSSYEVSKKEEKTDNYIISNRLLQNLMIIFISGTISQADCWISYLYRLHLFGSSESHISSNSLRYSRMDHIHSQQMMLEVYDGKTLGISSFINLRKKLIMII